MLQRRLLQCLPTLIICLDQGQLISQLVPVPLVHSADFRDKGEERTAATAAILSYCSKFTHTHSLISLSLPSKRLLIKPALEHWEGHRTQANQAAGGHEKEMAGPSDQGNVHLLIILVAQT
jgi:hypothetical protein